MPYSLPPHGLQHTRPTSPSPYPGACSHSCPSSQWCHPTISSAVPFPSWLQSFPTSWPFLMTQFFASSCQSIAASASASVLPVNIQSWFPLGLTGLISCCTSNSQESSPALQFEGISSSMFSFFYCPALTSIHDYWKNHSIDLTDLCYQSNKLCFLIHCLGLSLLFLQRASIF